MGGHSRRAIADFLGVTPNAVKTRLYAARRRLRRHMPEIEEGLGAARPSGSPEFAERVRRLTERDPPAVRALLDASPELAHAADATGNRPIHWATMSRQPEVIDELLAR